MTTPDHGQSAASYSRYSSDNQRETSIEDQERLQDRRAQIDGLHLVARFSDREISAAIPTLHRPGGRRLLEAARRGEFEVLLIEALDRCWHDIVDQEQTIRGLEFAGIRIVGISDGYDSRQEDREFARVVRGGANQQYLRDLAKKTHRGLTGQVCRGGHAGGLSYGYRSIDGGRVRKLEIDDGQAPWVLWVFARYADGWSCQRIAAELNRRRVPTGRGGTWAVSALYGSPDKGSGVLNNEVYVGRYIWNRSKWVTNPDSHKRIRLARPRDEWIVEQRPELRIVSDDLWQAAQQRMHATRLAGGSRGKGARPRTLFGGLLRCGVCGGAVVAVSASAYGCAAHKDRGEVVCAGVRVGRRATDVRLLAVIREELLAPAAVVELRRQVDILFSAHAKGADAESSRLRGDLAAVVRQVEHLIDAIAAGGHSDALIGRLSELEAQRAHLVKRIAGQQRTAMPAIDDLMARYRRHLANLEGALQADPERSRQALIDYFGAVTIDQAPDGTWATFQADPGRLLLAVAGDSGFGCGGAILLPESRRIRLI